MKYYLIAGEASGDLHASNLIRALKKNDPEAEFRCFGGDLMRDAGATVHIHYREMAMMGLVEVISKYGVIRRNREKCRNDILNWRPDVLILVDYSGFNLPMARFAAQHQIRVIYYISPKLWAWAKWRVKTVRQYVEKMFVLLPFEVDFYAQKGVKAEYYGNPVLDSVTAFENAYSGIDDFSAKNNLPAKPIIALLAGSRKQEISALLPEMLAVIPSYPQYHFVVAGAPSIDPAYYEQFTSGHDVSAVYAQTYELLKNAAAAVVTSGTATLETALLKVPQVVVYKTNPVTLFIGRFFVRVRFFSLVNLILNSEAIKELLQYNLADDINSELNLILNDMAYRNKMLTAYEKLQTILGNAGVAERVANRITQIVQP